MLVKHFIAGAICPSCSTMDTIRVFTSEGKKYRECVECHSIDVMRPESNINPVLPKTRISQKEKNHDLRLSIVKIIG